MPPLHPCLFNKGAMRAPLHPALNFFLFDFGRRKKKEYWIRKRIVGREWSCFATAKHAISFIADNQAEKRRHNHLITTKLNLWLVNSLCNCHSELVSESFCRSDSTSLVIVSLSSDYKKFRALRATKVFQHIKIIILFFMNYNS